MPFIQDFTTHIIDNVEHVILGKREVIELLMVALLCEGHVLIEDVPGVGKTMLARSIAISLGGQFKRLQCRTRSNTKARFRCPRRSAFGFCCAWLWVIPRSPRKSNYGPICSASI